MIVDKCVFVEGRDICETDQFGFVDLNAAFESGSLPVQVPASDASFDALSGTPLAPSQVLGVPADVFDAYEMRDALRRAARDADESASAAAAAAAAKPAAATSGES